jgi:DNA-binding LytR/AlgR family response regulator
MIPLRVLAVDDEKLALRRLYLLLSAIRDVEHVGDAGSCREALAKISSLRPDVVLLDIKMRDGTGFDVIDAIAGRPSPPIIVFVTAFDNFAVRAFESAAADYLLKPVEQPRLARALARARRQLRGIDAEQRIDELQAIVRNLRSAHEGSANAFETEFWLKSRDGLVHVPIDTIDYVSSEDDYVAIHTAAGSHLMRGSIRQFEDKVGPDLFIRVHRRWLVRKAALAGVRRLPIGGTQVILRNGKHLPAGRVYLRHLKQIIQGDRLS